MKLNTQKISGTLDIPYEVLEGLHENDDWIPIKITKQTSMKPTPRQFAAICFLVLMDHHGDSYREAHPNYIDEKLALLDMGYDAFGLLDGGNQSKVYAHLESWGYQLPDELKET